jgi:hypothetical protein
VTLVVEAVMHPAPSLPPAVTAESFQELPSAEEATLPKVMLLPGAAYIWSLLSMG